MTTHKFRVFRVFEDGHVETPGVDMGSGGVTLMQITRDRVAFKWHGASHWSGRGEQTYAPTSFIIGTITSMSEPIEVPSRAFGVMRARDITFDWLMEVPQRKPDAQVDRFVKAISVQPDAAG